MKTHSKWLHSISPAVVVLLALGTSISSATALADGGPTSQFSRAESNFVTQYQQNVNVESKLFQQAQSTNVTTTQIAELSSHVKFIQAQYGALFNTEQTLATNLSQTIAQQTPNETAVERAQIANLTRQRDSLVRNIRGAKFKRHRDGDHSGSSPSAQTISQWQAELNSLNQQIAQLNQAIHLKFFPQSEEGALNNLRRSILQLQQIAIGDTKLWIRLEQNLGNAGGNGSTGSSSSTSSVASLAIAPSLTQVNTGGRVIYTVQLRDAAGGAVQTSGVRIDFALVNGVNDGALSSTYAFTNSQGQANVLVTAGNQAGNIQVSAQMDGSTLPPAMSSVVQVQSVKPPLESVLVENAGTIVLTYGSTLNATHVPSVNDYRITWNGGVTTPKSVIVSGSSVTLQLWGNMLAHGDTVSVSYTAGSDTGAVVSVLGGAADNFNVQATNNL